MNVKATPFKSAQTSVSMLWTMLELFLQMRLGRGMSDPYNLNPTATECIQRSQVSQYK